MESVEEERITMPEVRKKEKMFFSSEWKSGKENT